MGCAVIGKKINNPGLWWWCAADSCEVHVGDVRLIIFQ